MVHHFRCARQLYRDERGFGELNLSQLLGRSSFDPLSVTAKNDESVMAYHMTIEAWQGWRYIDVLWPRSRFLGGGGAISNSPWDTFAATYTMWNWSRRAGGAQMRWQVYGRCLAGDSTPIPFVAVTLFDNTNVAVDFQTSDSGGNYVVGSPYGAGRSFAVAYKVGSPDKAGTSSHNIP
jgi:hypothetical protein